LRVEQHIQAIIESPDILISPNATFVAGSMDGKQWENPGAVEAILKQAPALPHLKDLLVRFSQMLVKLHHRVYTWWCN